MTREVNPWLNWVWNICQLNQGQILFWCKGVMGTRLRCVVWGYEMCTPLNPECLPDWCVWGESQKPVSKELSYKEHQNGAQAPKPKKGRFTRLERRWKYFHFGAEYYRCRVGVWTYLAFPCWIQASSRDLHWKLTACTSKQWRWCILLAEETALQSLWCRSAPTCRALLSRLNTNWTGHLSFSLFVHNSFHSTSTGRYNYISAPLITATFNRPGSYWN